MRAFLKNLLALGVGLLLAAVALESYNDVTRSVAQAEGAHLADLADVLSKSSHYFYDTMHFTNAGAEKVSEILYADLSPYLRARFPDESVAVH